jgi:hypothetical protein
MKTGPKCDTLFEKWRPEAVAHIKEHGPFAPEILLLWAFREGFRARGERDRKASQSDAAHWEHKYSNARQYNRNLETRNQQLKAALREIADFAEQFIGDDEDGDERMYKVHQIADNAIPFVAETKVV